MPEMGTAGRQRVGDVGGRRLGVFTQPGQQIIDPAANSRLGPARQHEQERPRGSEFGPGGRGLLNHHMGVRATEPEGTDRRHARPVAHPRPCRGVHDEGAVGEVDMPVWRGEMQGRRQDGMAHGLHGLDQPRDPGRGHRVADIGLDRADRAESLVRREGRESIRQRRNLDGITQARAGAVRLDQADMPRVDVGSAVDLSFQFRLRRGAGRGQAAGLAVLVDPRPAHHSQHPVAIPQCVGQALQDDDANAFAWREAVGGVIESGAAPVRRRHAGIGQIEEDRRRQQVARHSGRERHVSLSGTQALAGQMERHEGGGASGIHREGRPLQVQEVRQPRRQDRHRPAERLEAGGGGGGVGVGGGADEDAAAQAIQLGRGGAGALQRVPGFFQQQALLRVHRLGFRRRDGEEQRVEAVVIRKRRGPARIGLTWLAAFSGVVRGHIEAVDFPHGRMAGEDIAPERLHIRRVGEAASHADDGDGLVKGGASLGHHRPARRAMDRLCPRPRSGDRHGFGRCVPFCLFLLSQCHLIIARRRYAGIGESGRDMVRQRPDGREVVQIR